MSDSEDEAHGLEDAEVVTKYKLAGEMANRVLKQVSDAVKEDATALELCELGDSLILKETGAVFNKKVEGKLVEKGIGFPTCISVNNCICHNSPLKSEAAIVLKKGDIVKIDLGVHIDGYIAVAATTVAIGATKENPITGKAADAVLAAYYAAEAALRLIAPGKKSGDVTKAIQKIAEDFHCKPIEGMLSHQLQRNRIDGEKAVIQNPTEALKKEHKECEFAENEVYGIDVIISSGEGKPRRGDQKCTVHKRTENTYQLKMKTSRALYSEISKKFTMMPFTLRACGDESKARIGIQECVKHTIVEPFEIMWEKEGEFVAQFKILALLMPNGNLRATTSSFDPSLFKSEHEITDEEIKKLLQTSVGSKKKKKKKNKKPAAAKDAAAAAPAE